MNYFGYPVVDRTLATADRQVGRTEKEADSRDKLSATCRF